MNAAADDPTTPTAALLLGLRTTIYPAPDLAASTAWFTEVLGFGPYFDEPFYVGFEVAGYELGLDPNRDPAAGVSTLWGVADIAAARARLLALGATAEGEIQEVGDGIKVASVRMPGGAELGIIENPNFAVPPA